ncbi:MAG: hypothetical protein QGD93_12035, partial [Actinomycetota bacterium]|nr:hypothetical protein [Actinomycetota bacterium]
PGTPADSVLAMLRSFPDIGAPWQPAIPSFLIWAVACVVIALLGPLIWKLASIGKLRDEGARWATTRDLHSAGLLVADRSLTHAVPEAQETTDAG